MSYLLVNTGSIANSDTADTIRTGFHKVNTNFINLENKPITSSLTLPASVGGSAGVYLPININGTIYKIQLFNS